jgi:hypothetical protein
MLDSRMLWLRNQTIFIFLAHEQQGATPMVLAISRNHE